MLKLTPPNTHFCLFQTPSLTHTHTCKSSGGRSAAGSRCEKHPRGILEHWSSEIAYVSICKHVYLDALLCFCFQGCTVFWHVAFDVAAELLTSTWLHRGLLGAEFIKGLFDYAEQRGRIMTKSSVFKKKTTIITMCDVCTVWCVACASWTWHQPLKMYFSCCYCIKCKQ